MDAAVAHVATYHAAATLPFLIETGLNFLRSRPGELSDGTFIASVADGSDCGILLDLHNLLANERNGREPVSDVLSDLPLERVLEVHVAGGFEFDGYYLDAHVGGPDRESLMLLADVLPCLPNVRAVTFEAVPESLAALGAGAGDEDVREVYNYVAAMDHVLDPNRKLPLSLWLLREAHGILLSGVRGGAATPGEFRTMQNWIGSPGALLDGASHVPPPEHMWECLHEFEKHLTRGFPRPGC